MKKPCTETAARRNDSHPVSVGGIFRAALVIAVLLGSGSGSGSGAAKAEGQDTDASLRVEALNVDAPQDVFLEVSLNGRSTSKIVRFHLQQGHLYAAVKDLNEIGLKGDRIEAGGAADIALDAMTGLRYTYDAARQAVDLQVPDSMRRPYTFDTRVLSDTQAASSSSGLFINYDAFAQTTPDEQLALANDEHWFTPSGVFDLSGVAYLSRKQRRYLRYETSWTHSDAAATRTLQIGDIVTSSLAWNRSLRMGGFQWRSNFALRPDLVTFPIPALYGSAVVPSGVDVYINDVKRYSGDVPSGPFIAHTVPGTTGAGQATLITRDALGRTISTSVSLYVDPRMLAAGISSYSFEAGFLRRQYGLSSFSYDPHPAMSGAARYGLTDTLTVEGLAQATTHGLIDVGGGALMRLGQWGVVNGSVSASAGQFAGSQISAGYQLIEPRFSINAQTVRAYGNFGDLASLDGASVPSSTDQLTLSLPFARKQSISLSYIGSKYPHAPRSQIGSVAYTMSLNGMISLNLNAFKDFSQHNASGVFLSVSLTSFRDVSMSASVGRENGRENSSFDAIHTPDYGGGWGWGAQAGDTAGTPFQQAQVQYLGNDGEVTVIAQRRGQDTSASIDATGALVLMDRSATLSRHIGDGFALVSTDGIGGIPVSRDNRPLGLTDGSGHLLVPDLNAYQHNLVSIDPVKLPADARIGTTKLDLTPQSRSGVMAHFGITRYRAASIILTDSDGNAIPPGTPVHAEASAHDTVVGYDGVTFVEGLTRENELSVGSGTSRCTVRFGYEPLHDGSLPTIGPLTCERTKAAQ